MFQRKIKNLQMALLLLMAAVSFVMFQSCKSQPETTAAIPAPAAKQVTDSAVSYPINAYIRQQVVDVDTTPYFLYQLKTVNGKKDSTIVKRSVFDSTTKRFLYPDLEHESLKRNYAESVFQDATTNSYTFTYTAKQKYLSVQSASILLDTASQQVKWIFINALTSNDDSTVIERANWQGGKSCSISRSVSYKGGKESREDIKFVWNDKG